MAQVTISTIKDFPGAEFEVVVESNARTVHRVTLDEDYYKRLTNEKISPDELIRRSFLFLLERESNTSILDRFELGDIKAYFTDFEKVLKVLY